jgi:hypothetical protein
MNILRRSLLPLLLAGALFTQSCKEDSTGSGTNNDPVTNSKPTDGSTYTYYSKTTDNGSTTEEDTVVYTVEANVTEPATGQTGVYIYTPDNGEEPVTLRFESNGNVSILMPVITADNTGVQWFTLPVTGSGGTSNLLVLDVDLFGAHTKTTASAGFVGTENITINGKTYTAKKLKTTSNATVTVAGQSAVSSDDDYFWWVPELGFYGKSETGGQVQGPDAEPLTVESLVRFNID